MIIEPISFIRRPLNAAQHCDSNGQPRGRKQDAQAINLHPSLFQASTKKTINPHLLSGGACRVRLAYRRKWACCWPARQSARCGAPPEGKPEATLGQTNCVPGERALLEDKMIHLGLKLFISLAVPLISRDVSVPGEGEKILLNTVSSAANIYAHVASLILCHFSLAPPAK